MALCRAAGGGGGGMGAPTDILWSIDNRLMCLCRGGGIPTRMVGNLLGYCLVSSWYSENAVYYLLISYQSERPLAMNITHILNISIIVNSLNI